MLGLPEVPKATNLPRAGAGSPGERWKCTGEWTRISVRREKRIRVLVEDLAALIAKITAAGFDVKTDEPLEGYERGYVDESVRNRIGSSRNRNWCFRRRGAEARREDSSTTQDPEITFGLDVCDCCLLATAARAATKSTRQILCAQGCRSFPASHVTNCSDRIGDDLVGTSIRRSLLRMS